MTKAPKLCVECGTEATAAGDCGANCPHRLRKYRNERAKPAPEEAYRTVYKAGPCRCGWPTCRDWHVDPVASLQGVKFTQAQAELVAAVLNATEGKTYA